MHEVEKQNLEPNVTTKPDSMNKVLWFHGLQFRLLFNALVLFIVSIIIFLLIITAFVKEKVTDSEMRLLSQVGMSLVGDINQINASTEVLAKAIANVVEGLPKTEDAINRVLPSLINQYGLKEVVAGGGVWPEPYNFDTQRERHSFFWARNQSGELESVDDYNNPEGRGYFQEEWYVPVKLRPKNSCYWSKSYYDPYTFEPMVTCSVPVKNQNAQFSGVATIDVKLSGLTALLEKATSDIDGYAFVVDRNNKFLSYPDADGVEAKIISFDKQGHKIEDFLSVHEFSKTYSSYQVIADALNEVNRHLIDSVKKDNEVLVSALVNNSYQITQKEAPLLAAILSNKGALEENSESGSFRIEKDIVLGEAAIAQVLVVPNTYWKVVLITPNSAISEKVNAVVYRVVFYISSISILLFILGYWILGSVVIKPFHDLVVQLSNAEEKGLDETRKDEFGLIAMHVNNKTRQLTDVNKKISIAIDKREHADKLRKTSEKRYEKITTNAPDAIISVNKNGLIIDCNPAALVIFNYQKKELVGRLFITLLAPNDSPSQLLDINRYLKGELDALISSHLQIQAVKSDGIVFSAEFSATSWRTEKGRFFSIFMRDVSKRLEAEYKLRHQALHDALTQLPNRRLFNDRLAGALAQAKRNKSLLAVMIIDLDNFKIINDTMGHAVGDKLLQSIAENLLQAKRGADTIARLGGDEFGVIQANIRDPLQVLLFSNRLRDLISGAVIVDGKTFQVGCSIGVTIFPDDTGNAENLLKNADMAMYAAKENGKNTVRFFVEEMNIEIQNKQKMLESIAVALKQEQFSIYFQPLINLTTNKIVAAEALIRWYHPEKGYILPADFIPIAEQTNTINEIGGWVMRQVCQTIKKMDDLGLPKITIALNISPEQFKRENIFESLDAIAMDEQVSASRIECEITENAVMDDVDRVIEIMHSLKNSGYKLSIDDFGAGYSSLSYLKRFPIDKIKIDKSFISDIVESESSASIARAIIELGHSMKLEVLAEGVETQEQEEWLAAHKCDLIQGHYRAKPMPFSDFVTWINANA